MSPATHILSGIGLALVATAGFAADTDGVRPAVVVPSFVSLVGNLMLIVAAVFVVGWLMRRHRGMSGGGAQQPIRVLAAHSLGARDRLLVVQVADQQLVLGQTSQGIATLYVPEQRLVEPAPADATAPAFAERLRRALAGGER